ncbi:Biotin carboxylase [Ruminococcus flavefaciens]|uniref:Biotin carboxylase n=1 Tax=Ruminococcus flavefaciens TaxID=1265 RepID=A0A1H6JXB7_RUMFL|nr:ATP-grasp domain-containing protein [Ruminococcus flavefaciens]SEH64659.1 Biotin carboxylase [Ruminococcus flavefaciens]
MKQKEKLLIIGASIGQVPLLEKAKARGIHVTVATIPGKYPCISMADDVIYLDIYDRDGIVKEANKRCITAVISDQNDLMNPTVAYVAEKLGIPGNRFDTVETYCNKNFFRNACDQVGVPSPKHIAVNSVDFDLATLKCPLPWIVKPADSQSSIGVQRIDSLDELKPALEFALSKSPTHCAIVEEYFFGRELVCEGFINDGNYYLLSFADRKYFDLPDLLIPSQTLFPSVVQTELLERIISCEKKLTAYTKPAFAIVHSEYLFNEQTGEIRIVESALRGGGVYISSDLIPMATGIDINNVLLCKALGENVDIDAVFAKRQERASGYVCFYLPDGVIEEVKGADDVKALPFVRKAYIDDLVVGKRTERMTYKGARKGPILVSGADRNELEANIRTVQETFQIVVRNNNGEAKGIIWS